MWGLWDYHSFSVCWHFWWTLPSLYFGRNCGNVFCAGCCHLKLPIPDQQLYDPVLVCNSCYEHIQVSRARELMSQHLKKPIATASSWMPEEATCPISAGLKGGAASGVVWKVPWCGSWNHRAQRYGLEKSSLVPRDWSREIPIWQEVLPWWDPHLGVIMVLTQTQSLGVSCWVGDSSFFLLGSQDDDFIDTARWCVPPTAIERHMYNQTPSDNQVHLSSTLKKADYST